jgi:hypothetical protein
MAIVFHLLVLKYAKNDKFAFEGNKSKMVRRTVLTYKSGPHFKKVSETWLRGITATSQEIRVKPGILDRVENSVRRRAKSCVEMHGNHIEHLL